MALGYDTGYDTDYDAGVAPGYDTLLTLLLAPDRLRRFPEFTPQMMELLIGCLHPDPARRLSAQVRQGRGELMFSCAGP